MLTKEFYTVGIVAKMLDVDRKTIRNYFDQGILWGKSHPVTGWREINRKSIEILVEKLGITIKEEP